ncbi:hypothetical protein [Occultella gossypii]|uniref:DUF3592 domain-containing protein n=1 Tax=Occultella gossypii TaxID=2800820 RepID=A0ABS7SFB7_9MICO|nr:hypothetical protein [Occultella gossypii]MBZ2199052.1 hypothetical protein [Occultella gossypii]
MLPAEFAALRRADARSGRSVVMVAIIAVLCAVFPVTLYVLTGDIAADHLLGRTEKVQARVESVTVEGRCNRSSVDRYRVELSWSTDGAPDRGSYSTCGNDPVVGETVDAWVAASGHMTADSPTGARLGMAGLGLFLGGGAAAVGSAFVVQARRRRRRLLAAAAGELAPAELVALTRIRNANFRVRPAAGPPGSTSVGSSATTVLYSRAGVPTRRPAPRAMEGPWQLRMAPATDARGLVALLTRGPERCWVDIAVRR